MDKQWSGAIVNISSVVGLYGNSGQAKYAAVKACRIGFAKALSAGITSHNVRFNAAAPGYTNTETMAILDQVTHEYVTPRIFLKRLGAADDVAPSVCYLISDQPTYIFQKADCLWIN